MMSKEFKQFEAKAIRPQYMRKSCTWP